MKRNATAPVVFIIALLLLVPVCLTFASILVIKLQDGTSVSYDTSKISSMFFADAPATIQSGGTPLLMENFNNGLSNMWEPIQVVGGNFERFAKIANGKLAVFVPPGNSWGKTGIMSRAALFSIDPNMAAHPLKLTFEFDPATTTGYIIALSPAKDADVWRVNNAWFHWGKPSFIEGKAYLVNTQNQGDKGGEINTPALAPKTVTFSVQPGRVEATTSDGSQITAQISWMKEGVPVYLYIFSHPWRQNEAASLSLKSIKITQRDYTSQKRDYTSQKRDYTSQQRDYTAEKRKKEKVRQNDPGATEVIDRLKGLFGR